MKEGKNPFRTAVLNNGWCGDVQQLLSMLVHCEPRVKLNEG
jgi:hypothetical protein